MGLMEQLNERISEKIATVVPRAIQPTFTWETAIGYLAHCADNESGGPIGIMYYKLPSADQIDSISPVKEYLNAYQSKYGKSFDIVYGDRRPGDLAISEVPFVSKFMNVTKNLEDIV